MLGGVGVGAASIYYRELARAAVSRGFELELVLVNADTPHVLKLIGAGDRAGLAEYLNGFIGRMQAAGAVFAAIPSVTTHYARAEMVAAAAIPVVDLFAPLAAEVERRGVRRVALLGTSFVIQSGLYGYVPGLEFAMPTADEIAYISKTYLDVAAAGFGTDEQREGLRRMAWTLIEREKVDAVVMAGTDLSLIFNEGNTEFPHLDCAGLHIAAIAERIFGE